MTKDNNQIVIHRLLGPVCPYLLTNRLDPGGLDSLIDAKGTYWLLLADIG